MTISAHNVLKNSKEEDMSVKIITDSTSDITQTRAAELGGEGWTATLDRPNRCGSGKAQLCGALGEALCAMEF